MKNIWISRSRRSSRKDVVNHIVETNGVLDIGFGSHKACITKNHFVTVIRDNVKQSNIPVTKLQVGDTLVCPNYLTDPKIRLAILNNLTFGEMKSL